MKKTIILLMAVLLVINITGCGGCIESNTNQKDLSQKAYDESLSNGETKVTDESVSNEETKVTDESVSNEETKVTDESVSNEETKVTNEIVLNKDNISEYLKIDFSVEDICVFMTTVTSPPMDKGEGKLIIKTKALKRGDFEDVKIGLLFKSDRGWNPEYITIILPFDGNVTETKNLLSYATLLYDNPRYEMTISSVSGRFVK